MNEAAASSQPQSTSPRVIAVHDTIPAPPAFAVVRDDPMTLRSPAADSDEPDDAEPRTERVVQVFEPYAF